MRTSFFSLYPQRTIQFNSLNARQPNLNPSVNQRDTFVKTRFGQSDSESDSEFTPKTLHDVMSETLQEEAFEAANRELEEFKRTYPPREHSGSINYKEYWNKANESYIASRSVRGRKFLDKHVGEDVVWLTKEELDRIPKPQAGQQIPQKIEDVVSRRLTKKAEEAADEAVEDAVAQAAEKRHHVPDFSELHSTVYELFIAKHSKRGRRFLEEHSDCLDRNWLKNAGDDLDKADPDNRSSNAWQVNMERGTDGIVRSVFSYKYAPGHYSRGQWQNPFY